jgi:hypothetical protein
MSGGISPDILKEIEAAQAEASGGRGLPPIHKWQPDKIVDLDMRIHRDGRWDYQGTPIGRKRMVRLFSTVLRKDGDEYFLVTPPEKLRITVDDAPFVAIAMEVKGEGKEQVLIFTTNVGDVTVAGTDAPIRMEIDEDTGEPAPYVLVRDRLEALVGRAVFYDLVELGVEEEVGGKTLFGVWSGGTFFPFADAAHIKTP